MFGKSPKNSDKYFWTTHSIYKMRQYGLSEQKIRNVIKSPFRKEEGIVKNTVAAMQPVSSKLDGKKKIWKQEIWVMYQIRKAENPKSEIRNPKQFLKFKIQNFANQQIRIISAWRYPGVSPKRNPIPEEIIRELSELGN